ncbi:MAG: acyl-CoA dehydrogenase family protein [Tumebacillaceae bacterium]
MILELNEQQKAYQAGFRAFVDEHISPVANRLDQEEYTPPELIRKVAEQGYLGAILPTEVGGLGMDMISFGLLNEEFGRGCSSLRSLLTVHTMCGQATARFGTPEAKAYWLPKLASGEKIGAFALSEPNIGSDAKNVQTTARPEGDHYVLNGKKKWITYGQIADVFLFFAQVDGKPSAFLVESNTPGLTVHPIKGIYGTRASMLAELHLEECRIPKGNLLGREGFGFPYVALSALDYGKYSVAWGAVGVGQACLEASLQYTSERKQFDQYLKEFQLIQEMLTEMVTNVKAARLLCLQAGYLRENGDPRALNETSVAKYFASRMANKAANDAVQIHGANGMSMDYPVQRYLRDTKVSEIIEGSSQMQQMTIAQYGFQEHGRL